MSMKYIRQTYGVPAKRGARVTWCAGRIGCRDGVIVGTRSAYLRVRLNATKRIITLHPYDVKYQTTVGQESGK